jgi:exosome complex RNA-binding protein Rrp4
MATPTTLPSTFTAGQVLTAAQMNNLRGAFRVLQVVTATYSTQTDSSSSTFADTGLTASITPSATSSKILVVVQQAGCGKVSSDTELQLQLLRGATSISTFATQVGLTSSTAVNIVGTQGTIYLDSPATTSSTTYKTQMRSVANTSKATTQANGCMSTIALLEISA